MTRLLGLLAAAGTMLSLAPPADACTCVVWRDIDDMARGRDRWRGIGRVLK